MWLLKRIHCQEFFRVWDKDHFHLWGFCYSNESFELLLKPVPAKVRVIPSIILATLICFYRSYFNTLARLDNFCALDTQSVPFRPLDFFYRVMLQRHCLWWKVPQGGLSYSHPLLLKLEILATDIDSLFRSNQYGVCKQQTCALAWAEHYYVFRISWSEENCNSLCHECEASLKLPRLCLRLCWQAPFSAFGTSLQTESTPRWASLTRALPWLCNRSIFFLPTKQMCPNMEDMKLTSHLRKGSDDLL